MPDLATRTLLDWRLWAAGLSRRPDPRRRPTPAPTPTRPSCSHPAEALTTRPTLGRAAVQTCECGKQWVIRP